MGVSCAMRLFSVLMFAENLKRFNRKGPIVQILTFMRLAEIIGNVDFERNFLVMILLLEKIFDTPLKYKKRKLGYQRSYYRAIKRWAKRSDVVEINQNKTWI